MYKTKYSSCTHFSYMREPRNVIHLHTKQTHAHYPFISLSLSLSLPLSLSLVFCHYVCFPSVATFLSRSLTFCPLNSRLVWTQFCTYDRLFESMPNSHSPSFTLLNSLYLLFYRGETSAALLTCHRSTAQA